MAEKIVVCIPTKSRINTKTYKLFGENFKVLHFIEPKEIDSYIVPEETKINIGKDNGGITYVRNFILDYAKSNNLEWIMICDDDVTGFGKSIGTKTIKSDSCIWVEILNKVKKLPFELVGINYVQHAWHEKKSYSVNSKFPEVCVLLNIAKIDWRYEDNTKEDRDFTLETIRSGYGTIRFNKYWFSCPDVGTNKGGLSDLYESKKDTVWAENLTKKWKPHVKLVKKKNRIDAKVDIKAVARQYDKVVK